MQAESRTAHLTSVLVLRRVRRDPHARRHQREEHAAHVHHLLQTQSSTSCPAQPSRQRTALCPHQGEEPWLLPTLLPGANRRSSTAVSSWDPGIGVTGSRKHMKDA